MFLNFILMETEGNGNFIDCVNFMRCKHSITDFALEAIFGGEQRKYFPSISNRLSSLNKHLCFQVDTMEWTTS